jgi:hypothetical protein
MGMEVDYIQSIKGRRIPPFSVLASHDEYFNLFPIALTVETSVKNEILQETSPKKYLDAIKDWTSLIIAEPLVGLDGGCNENLSLPRC